MVVESGVATSEHLVAQQERPIVELFDVHMHYVAKSSMFSRRPDAVVRAVDGVSLTVPAKRTLGVVGESGSGKTTLGSLVLGMIKPTQGRVVVDGRDISNIDKAQLRAHQRTVQVVLQDPYSSLNPRMQVGASIAEPLAHSLGRWRRKETDRRVCELMELVGLPPSARWRYPHQFSGGQRQRIAIARAIAPNPALIVLDEPTSALDVSVRAQILNLLRDLQDELGLTYVLISHDFSTVSYLSETIAVMYLGHIVEMGPTNEVLEHPKHPYTELLISSVLDTSSVSADIAVTDEDIPSALALPSGCRFHPRCAMRRERGFPEECSTKVPDLRDVEGPRSVACHFVDAEVEGAA